MNIARTLAEAARRYGDRPAVSKGSGVVLRYADLARRAASLAAWLRGPARLAVGDRVGIAMPNRPEYLEILFGIWLGGLCAVPMNARLHARELEYILESSGARICFTAGETLDALAAVPSLRSRLVEVGDARAYSVALAMTPSDAVTETGLGDPAWLFYTSGTTGRPKGATLTHRNLWMMAMAHWADIGAVGPRATMIHAAPLSHGCGLWSIAAVGRATNNVMPESASYDPEEICRLVDTWPSISMYHAPTMLKRLVNCPALGAVDLARLDTVIYGGSHVYVADLIRALDALGPRLVQIYGQGESPNTITMLGKAEHAEEAHPDRLARLASAGTTRSGVEFRIVDPEDRPVPPGGIGEVVVRGDIVMAGYWRDEVATRATLKGGWLHTGDIGAADAAGFLTLKDRAKDMIISGGSNIYPREVEEVLLKHPSVLEASVLGRPHPEWGEEVIAFVVPRPGQIVDAQALDRLCLEEIARYKRPRAYFFETSLPKSNYGKILKRELRQRLGGAGAAP